jgi:hypothetical protein
MPEISCAETAKLRAEVDANPWFCHGLTESGYHRFSADPTPEEECEYFGCYLTWGELDKLKRSE